MSNVQLRNFFEGSVFAVTKDMRPVIVGDLAPAEYKAGRLVLPDSLSDREQICSALTAILHASNNAKRGWTIVKCKEKGEEFYKHLSEEDKTWILKLFKEKTDKVLL